MAKQVMISVSGIRGIVGDGLTPELLVNYSAAAGTIYGKGKVMVGRDSRVTGKMIKSAVFCGLQSVGCSPVDLGICPTPSVELAVQDSDAVGGIIITASHNPIEWNALKLLGSDGLFFDKKQGEIINEIVHKSSYNYATWNEIGSVSEYNKAVQDHIRKILKLPYLDIKAIRQREFKVAYDCVNGAGGIILPYLFAELGCKSFPINEEPSGIFAHSPEPVPENLKQLSRCVAENKADIGFAVDPDVDRVAVVAETGEPIGEEYTLALASKFILSKKKGGVVVNLSTSRACEDIANETGVDFFRTPVGEVNVVKKMIEEGAVIGGEGNGGVILPEIHPGRDAPVGIALLLQYLCEYEGKASALWKSLPEYRIMKKKIEIGSRNPDEIMERLLRDHNDDKLNCDDGIRIELPQGWIHIRKSNTEPIIRVVAETKTKENSEKLCSRMINEIKRL